MEVTYREIREDKEAQKRKILRKKKKLQIMAIAAAAGLVVGIGIGAATGSIGKKKLKKEVAALTTQVSDKEKEMASIKKELQSVKSQAVVDEEEVKLPWNLVLVNKWNEMEEGYEPPELVEVAEDMEVDSRIAEALSQMLADAKAEGLDPFICSAYRSVTRQENLFDSGMKQRLNSGLGYYDAFEKTASVIAVPGTSEHALGLAVDIISVSNTNLDETQEETKEFKWFAENCYKYGFILRYPNGTTDITGMIYEPWHYRYVGVEVAQEIQTLGVTLEEYLQDYYLK